MGNKNVIPYKPYDLMDKVIIVTGANIGLGYASAKYFYRQNAKVILACRSSEKANEAIEQLKKDVPEQTNTDNLIHIPLDLANFDSIDTFVENFNSLNLPLNVLMNNAGFWSDPSRMENGMEKVFGVNHMGHFLLTWKLLPKLKQAKDYARIVNLASKAAELNTVKKVDKHFTWNWDLHFNTSEKLYKGYTSYKGMMTLYGDSKLANILHMKKMQRVLNDDPEGNHILCVSVHPGAVATQFLRNIPPWMFSVIKPFIRTPDYGAQTQIVVASAPKEIVEEWNGG